jgi:hypothetical protein
VLDDGLVDQVAVAGCLARRRIKEFFFDLGVDLQGQADFIGQRLLLDVIGQAFIGLEIVFDLAVIGLQQGYRVRAAGLWRGLRLGGGARGFELGFGLRRRGHGSTSTQC